MTVSKRHLNGDDSSEVLRRLDEVSATLSGIASDLGEMRNWQGVTDVHIKNIIGPPTIEERMRTYADSRDDHKVRGLQDYIGNTAKLQEQSARIMQLEMEAKIAAQQQATAENGFKIDASIKARDEQNREVQAKLTEICKRQEDQTTKQESQARMLYIGWGMLLLLQFLLPFIIPYLFGIKR